MEHLRTTASGRPWLEQFYIFFWPYLFFFIMKTCKFFLNGNTNLLEKFCIKNLINTFGDVIYFPLVQDVIRRSLGNLHASYFVRKIISCEFPRCAVISMTFLYKVPHLKSVLDALFYSLVHVCNKDISSTTVANSWTYFYTLVNSSIYILQTLDMIILVSEKQDFDSNIKINLLLLIEPIGKRLHSHNSINGYGPIFKSACRYNKL